MDMRKLGIFVTVCCLGFGLLMVLTGTIGVFKGNFEIYRNVLLAGVAVVVACIIIQIVEKLCQCRTTKGMTTGIGITYGLASVCGVVGLGLMLAGSVGIFRTHDKRFSIFVCAGASLVVSGSLFRVAADIYLKGQNPKEEQRRRIGDQGQQSSDSGTKPKVAYDETAGKSDEGNAEDFDESSCKNDSKDLSVRSYDRVILEPYAQRSAGTDPSNIDVKTTDVRKDECKSEMPAWLIEHPDNLTVVKRTEKWKKQIKQLVKDEKAYKMTKHGLRKCLIIANIKFQGANDLPGNEKDSLYLEALFKNLEFDLEVQSNLTAEGIRKALSDVRDTNAECFVCVISSHGNETGIMGTDCNVISVQEIKTLFRNDKVKYMNGKPKLFFFDVCRGAGNQDVSKFLNKTENPPPKGDIYVAHATAEGDKSFCSSEHGSWFSRTLVHMIEQEACSCDIEDIVTQVGNEVGKYKSNDGCQQAPERITTLRKKFFFYIPVNKK